MSRILTYDNLMFMLKGASVSLALALGSVAIGCLLGVLFSIMKLSKNKLLNILATVYVELFRGTPMLLQILFFYLGIPVLYQRIFGARLNANPYIVGLIALSANSGAYQTELIRSGIQSVDRGQWEASEALGIDYKTMMKEIILPQAFKNIIPPLVSEFIMLIKDSSLISSIGAIELLYAAQILGKNYYNYLDPLLVAGVMYLIMTTIVSILSRKLEKRLKASD